MQLLPFGKSQRNEKFIDKFHKHTETRKVCVFFWAHFIVRLFNAILFNISSMNVSQEKHKNITFNKRVLSANLWRVAFIFPSFPYLLGEVFLLRVHSQHFTLDYEREGRENNFHRGAGNSLKFMNSGERAYVLVFYHLLHTWSFVLKIIKISNFKDVWSKSLRFILVSKFTD